MTDSSISVVIAAYNSAATIEECLRSLAEQSLRPAEIIVVDDGSTDATAALASGGAKVVRNARSKGPAGARNTGAYLAQGNFLVFTDSDCFLPRDWLKNIAAAFADVRVGGVGGGYCCGADASFWQVFSCEELAFRRRMRKGPVETLVSNNFACRRDLFMVFGGFPEQYPVCEDMLLSYQISRQSLVIWLPDNGVGHHFKTSFLWYLIHQYSFGAESTRFFLKNKDLLGCKNHQGLWLYVLVAIAWTALLAALLSMGMIFMGYFSAGVAFAVVSLILVVAHVWGYVPFIVYLFHRKFFWPWHAYGVCLVRDMVCGFSVFDGIVRGLIKK